MIDFIWHRALRQTRSETVSGSLSLKFTKNISHWLYANGTNENQTSVSPWCHREPTQLAYSLVEASRVAGSEKLLRLDGLCSLSISSSIFLKNLEICAGYF